MNEENRIERWRLPDGVDELLPRAAWRVERLRRRFVDLGESWGFELVGPPLIEYLDSLLTGTGEAMDLQTFKLVDQHDGRTLGVRADMTPQVARIDAHAMAQDDDAGSAAGVRGANRLLYTGSVLRARTDGFGGSRSPLQFGAELFGHAGPESDIELVRLMLDTVALTGLAEEELVLDLGHIGVYAGLSAEAELEPALASRLFEALVRGSVPDVAQALLGRDGRAAAEVHRIEALADLRGGVETIARARETLETRSPRAHDALDTLDTLVRAIALTHPGVRIHVDLAELRGYRYHTGMLFTVYDASGLELAHGGRYDAIGEAFGNGRPATGFSGDLKRLADIAAARDGDDEFANDTLRPVVIAPDADSSDAWREVRRRRALGERIVTSLPGADDLALARAEGELVRDGDGWSVRPLAPHGDRSPCIATTRQEQETHG